MKTQIIINKIATVVLLIANLAITACSPNTSVYTVDQSIAPFVNEFYSEAASRGIFFPQDSLIVKFNQDMPDNKLGECFFGGSLPPKVEVNPKFWSTASYWNKRELVFHELTHCLTEIKHNDTVDSKYAPTSIMNTYHLGENYYNESTHVKYDNELFVEIAVVWENMQALATSGNMSR